MKKYHLLSIVITCLLLVFGSVTITQAADATLKWAANTEDDLAGYKIYYKKGTPGPPYDGIGARIECSNVDENSPIIIPLNRLSDKNNPEITITGLSEIENTFLVVTAYDDEEEPHESGFSNEVYWMCFSPVKTFFDAQEGPTDRVDIYDKTPEGAEIQFVLDELDEGKVLLFTGSGMDNSFYVKGYENGLNEENRRVATFRFRTDEDIRVYFFLKTDIGDYWVKCMPGNFSPYLSGSELRYPLGNVTDDEWHTISLDLGYIFAEQFPTATINIVDKFIIRSGYCFLKYFKMSFQPINVYASVKEGPIDRLIVYDNSPAGPQINHVPDPLGHGYVYELIGSGMDNAWCVKGPTTYGLNATERRTAKIKFRTDKEIWFYFRLQTTTGYIYIKGVPGNDDPYVSGSCLFYPLGAITDNKWHILTLNLQEIFEDQFPSDWIIEIDRFIIRTEYCLLDYFLME